MGFTAQRGKNKGGHASKKRKKNVLYVFRRIWNLTCGQFGWSQDDPFVNASSYIEELGMAQKMLRAISRQLTKKLHLCALKI